MFRAGPLDKYLPIFLYNRGIKDDFTIRTDTFCLFNINENSSMPCTIPLYVDAECLYQLFMQDYTGIDQKGVEIKLFLKLYFYLLVQQSGQ